MPDGELVARCEVQRRTPVGRPAGHRERAVGARHRRDHGRDRPQDESAAEGLQAIALTPAQSWFAPAARERETEWRPPPPELWLSSAALELRDEGRTSASLTRACPGARCLDLDALEQAFGEPLRASSDRTLALRIDLDAPYETVVALLSWIRGTLTIPIRFELDRTK